MYLHPRRERTSPPRLTLGTMNFGKRTSPKEAERIIHRALERGIEWFDTANAYVDGESERILGRALAGRDGAKIATKVGFGRVAGRQEGLSGARVEAALDESLARLGRSSVELYYLHVPDPKVPIEETIGALGRAQAAGKFHEVGISNYASWQILEVMLACDAAGLARPTVAQQLYNLLIRQLDVEYFRFAEKYALHTTVYNPLAGGLLSGRYAADAAITKGSRFDNNRLYQGRYWSPALLSLAERFGAIANDEAMTLVDLAYAWLGTKPEVDSILLGPATLAHLDQALDAVEKRISEEGLARIEREHRDFIGTETRYAR